MKRNFIFKGLKTSSLTYLIAVAVLAMAVYSCNKSVNKSNTALSAEQVKQIAAAQAPQANTSDGTVSQVVTIANIRKSGDGSVTEVMFSRMAELFKVLDPVVETGLRDAFARNRAIKVTVNPWTGIVLSFTMLSEQETAARLSGGGMVSSGGTTINLSTFNHDQLNSPEALGVINTTVPELTNVVPDMATAQLMFDYIAHQCCAVPGPYSIDYCISFQYCEDGCYARAQKMCWIINTKYNYATHKIFSFANSGSDELCVKAEKWGGCCVNWWYHVAPLLNIKTTTGTQAFVFDPAMFDQPVLLSTWLHAQENPACVPSGDVPHVSMINIQPTTSYSPSTYSGYSFDTDPAFSNTDTTMVHYGPLLTCP